MDLSPKIYQWIVRPNWYNRYFTHNVLAKENIYHKRVLDFGCGVGSNCFLIKAENYLGVDIDKDRIEHARKQNPDYHFEIMKNVNFKKNSFEIILIIAVLHHIPNSEIKFLLKIFKKILKKSNGKILVIEPCYYKNKIFNNCFMNFFDKGKFIRNKDEYFSIFQSEDYRINSYRKLNKILYKEIFYSASL
ncbi:MAG: class I SAM-dependent methyltransferase [bacterium]